MNSSGKSIAQIFAAIACVAIVIALFPSDTPDREQSIQNIEMKYGVSVHNLTVTDLRLISDANFTWIRADDYQFPVVMNLPDISSFNILGIIHGEKMVQYGQVNYSAWNKTISNLLSLYGDRVQAWEILNEPLIEFPSGNYSSFPQYIYYNMLDYAYSAIKSAEPNSTVLGFGGIRIINGNIENLTWIQDLIDEGALNLCDAVSVHIYSSSSNAQLTGFNYNNALEKLRAMIGDKQAWITETGQPSDMNQVAYIKSVYPVFASNGINYVFWYEFRDFIPDQGKSFGLFEKDFTPRDSFNALKDMINNS